MHDIQQKLLELIKEDPDILKFSLNELVHYGVYAQSIKHHLSQLTRKGLIKVENGKVTVVEPQHTKTSSKLFNIPIVGAANCGDATMLAVENLEGYLKVSPKILNKQTAKGLIAIRAVGNSLNRAEDLKELGGPIDEGDYVIVDCHKLPKNGSYVLSVIDSAANLKKFYKEDGVIRLVSESTSNFHPILIHEDDFKNFVINGVVVRVIKN